ncbi:MAG: DNRLRE domain-containing protein [Chloroflexi bacterium]|nr:DNRLRE domain-containing protein [Chloroflexota bacterium]
MKPAKPVLLTLILTFALAGAFLFAYGAAASTPNRAPTAPTASNAQGEWQRVWKGDGWLYAMTAIDAQTLLGVGSEGMILSSNNAADTLHYQAPFPDYDLRDLSVVGNKVWAVGQQGVVLGSSDAGATWTRLAISVTANLNAVHFIDANTGWVAGDAGFIAQTTDGGVSWTPQTSGVTTNLNAIRFFADGLHGIAVGDDATLLTTTDGGSTWTTRSGVIAGAPDMQDIHVEGDEAWFVGADGKIYYSPDKGASWSILASLGLPWNEIEFAPGQNQVGWVAGPDGRVARTPDGGKTWPVRSGASDGYDLTALAVADPTHAWAGGSVLADKLGWDNQPSQQAWFLWRTREGTNGARWEAIIRGLYPRFFDIVAASEQEIYAAGWDMVVMKSEDGGYSWRELYDELRADPVLGGMPEDGHDTYLLGIDCAPNNPKDCTAVGRRGVIAHTTDGGDSWKYEYIPYSKEVYDIARPTDDLAIVTGRWQYFRTTNNGASWEETSDSSKTTGVDIAMANENTGVVAILKAVVGPRYTTTAGATWGHRPALPVEFSGWFLPGIETMDVDGSGIFDHIWYVGCKFPPGPFQHVVDPCDTYGGQGGILHSADGGFTWEEQFQPEGVTAMMINLEMVDELTGWAAGEYGVVLFTEDGGATWVQQDAPADNVIENLDVYDRNLVFAAGMEGVILRYAQPDRRLVAGPQWVNEVDGDLGEWSEAYLRKINGDDMDAISGDPLAAEELNADVRVRWDDDALYLGVQVTDSETVTSTGTLDRFGVAFDGLQDGLSGGADDQTLIFSADGGMTVNAGPPPADWTYVVNASANGYVIEARIPAAALGGDFAHLRKMGVNVMLSDERAAGQTTMIWAGDSLDGNPAAFGELTLFQHDRIFPTLESRSAGDMTIDGDLSEWSAEDAYALTANSADSVQGQPPADDADLSSALRLRWWEDYLFFGFQVSDDVLAAGDAIQISVDVDGDSKPSAADRDFLIWPDGRVMENGAVSERVLAAGQVITTGYQMEIAIPADLLGGPFDAHQTVHFNYALLDDDDDDGLPERRMNWQGASVNGIQADFGYAAMRPLTMTLKPPRASDSVDDAILDQWNPDKNYYNFGHLWVRSGGAQISLIRFALDALPSNAIIKEALLRLTTAQTHETFLQTRVYRLLRDWSEREVTWNQAANGSPWEQPGASGPTDRASEPTYERYLAPENAQTVWDVTKDVQDFVSGAAPNYGWLITGEATASLLYKMYSNDWTDETLLPEMNFEYIFPSGSLPTPTPAASPTATPTPTLTPTPTATPTATPYPNSLWLPLLNR